MPDTDTPISPDAWRQIARWLEATDVDCIELSHPGQQLRMLRGAAGYAVEEVHAPEVAARHAPRAVAGHHEVLVVKASVAGVFLDAHPAGGTPLVRPGDVVRAGDALGLIRIGLLLCGVRAPADGIVTAVRVTHGTPVGYGTPLIDIETDPGAP